MSRHRPGRQFTERFALVADGQCEQLYFSQLKTTERLQNVHIQLPYVQRGYKKAFEKSKELTNDFHRVFCLIDYDVILRDNHLAEFEKAVAKLPEKVNVLINHPCFELWLLLHFQPSLKVYGSCDDVVAELRNYIPDYCKELDYYGKRNIYGKLSAKLKTHALPNSINLEAANRNQDSPLFARAEMYKAIQQIFQLG